ncbi:MAG: hypothetical protein ACOX6Y_02775 [Christensenellales bacterium]
MMTDRRAGGQHHHICFIRSPHLRLLGGACAFFGARVFCFVRGHGFAHGPVWSSQRRAGGIDRGGGSAAG